MKQEILATCEVFSTTPSITLAPIPWKADSGAAPDGMTPIIVSNEGVQVFHQAHVEIDDLARTLAEVHEFRPPNTPRGWSLAISADTPTSTVHAVFEQLVAAKQPSGHLLLSTPATSLPAPRDPKLFAEIAPQLRSKDPSSRATFIAKKITENMPPLCAPMHSAFSAIATVAPEQRCPSLARGLSEAAVACGCPPMETLLTLVYAINVGVDAPAVLSVAVPIVLEPNAKARKGETWGAVVSDFDPATLNALWVGTKTP